MDWDDLCNQSPRGWIFHTKGWIQLETVQSSSKDVSFGIVKEGRLVAVMPLFISNLGLGPFVELLVHNGLHRHTGLAWAPDLGASEIKTIQNLALRRVLEIAHEVDADRVYLGEQNLTKESLSPARQEIPLWVTEFGFQMGNCFGTQGLVPAPGLASTVVDQIVVLTETEEKLFASLTKTCRYAVRTALSAGFQFSDLTSGGQCLAEYHRLATLSAKRTGEAIPAIDYFETIRDLLLPLKRCSFIFASLSGQNVGAAILLHAKESAYYFAGVSDPSYLSQGVNDFLQWKAIAFLKDTGSCHYRLGPYFPGLPADWPVAKVTRFKSKFGARPFSIIQGSKFLKPKRYARLAQEYVTRLCSEL